MTTKELAQKLNGRKYMNEISDAECAEAKAAGLVVVFGYSDDNMEFRGAIYEALGAYNGTTAYVTNAGMVYNHCDNEECPYFQAELKKATKIRAVWRPDANHSWAFETEIPHCCFEITEDGEPYCTGIVFALVDVTKPTTSKQ